jgi:hypothetical protein
MPRKTLFLAAILCVCVNVWARAATREEILPAGTIIHCTLDEPNFSSKTAQVGDPVLCHLGAVAAFGRPVFPRGAMLSGHLQESKDPGHLVGKGWLELEFDRIILPGAEVLPLQAKIIAAPHLKVDREGKMHGGGHPKRDAVGWMIPVLWPIKILTLPARGPYPALKGEARLTMRLMEDVEVPVTVARASVPAPPWANSSDYVPSSYGLLRPASMVTREPIEPQQTAQTITTVPPAMAPVNAAGMESAVSTSVERASANESRPTLLVLRGGSAFVATDYWVQDGQMHCVSREGQSRSFPLEGIDLEQTLRVNRERNVEFVLHTRGTVAEQ